jgi:hypothetical protein
LVLLESIAEVGGFDARAYGKRFVDTFGSLNYRGYLDKATQGTLENYRRFCETNPPDRYDFQQGADDDQLANASRLASLVARYWREPNLPDLAEGHSPGAEQRSSETRLRGSCSQPGDPAENTTSAR